MESAKPDENVIRKMRDSASHGSSVRELVHIIQLHLGRADDIVLPVLWYFVHAFKLPLRVVLPIREWLGTTDDQEIDATILPEIRTAMANWGEETPESLFADAVGTAQGKE